MAESTLVTTWYPDERKNRASELQLCLDLNSSSFSRVVVVSEHTRPYWCHRQNVCWWQTLERPTYADTFALTLAHALPDDLLVFANCDIAITWRAVDFGQRLLAIDIVWCLTVWGMQTQTLWDVDYSQDSWWMRGSALNCLAREGVGNYRYGVPGCDNRIAREIEEAGLCVQNPSRDVQTFHVHASAKRTETNIESNRVPAPYTYVRPHYLIESPMRKHVEKYEAKSRRNHVFRRHV